MNKYYPDFQGPQEETHPYFLEHANEHLMNYQDARVESIELAAEMLLKWVNNGRQMTAEDLYSGDCLSDLKKLLFAMIEPSERFNALDTILDSMVTCNKL